jgi:hypothetical protein
MEHYRQIKVGDRVAVRDAFGAWHRGQIAPVPKDWRDASGSHATTTRGDFPSRTSTRSPTRSSASPLANASWTRPRPKAVYVRRPLTPHLFVTRSRRADEVEGQRWR